MRLEPDTIAHTALAMREALEADRLDDAANLTQGLSTTRIAETLTGFDHTIAARCLLLMDPARAGRTLTRLPVEFAVEILETLPADGRPAIVNGIPADHLARLLDTLDDALREALIGMLSPRLRAFVAAAGHYEPGSAGRVMSP